MVSIYKYILQLFVTYKKPRNFLKIIILLKKIIIDYKISILYSIFLLILNIITNLHFL